VSAIALGTAVRDVPRWLREQDVDPGAACYVSADADAVLLPVAALRGPPDSRGYNPERLRDVLEALTTGTPWPAVPVLREPGNGAVLLDGAHRLAVARAIGLPAIPCLVLTRKEAELCYPGGERYTEL
jgi:hypothetical protein